MDGSATRQSLLLWGGVECTINRVQDRYYSQLERSAHLIRISDLDRFAALGIRAIRYPVLWEHIAPDGLDNADWSWPDERLGRLRALGVKPIVGLVHHGSGPRETHLADPRFAEKLAEYAIAVARRYPWVEDYTPINEPLTTARFSGLYGHWYPHGRDESTFIKILFNQCRAVVLAMQAIATINPNARLIQTDDLGRTYATPALEYQARFNNELRWLSWDLLTGRVTREHALWDWLVDRCGATADEILWFSDNARPPDIVGINHYVTSDRFLDGDVDRYAGHLHGGNGRERYVDVEAVRTVTGGGAGVAPLIIEAWNRYGLPIAITEAHIDARREDQMRWLAEIWTGAEDARTSGADVRAVTVWGLLGAYDWNSLLTKCHGYYESGAFDVLGPDPRPTAVAGIMLSLADGVVPNHPVLSGAGWWRRSDRPARGECSPRDGARPNGIGDNRAPILICGATGTLGRAFARICAQRDLNFRLLNRSELDITDGDSISRALETHEPWAIINAAGYVRVDDAEREAERCFRENTLGPSLLAGICSEHALALVNFSTDLVFDGQQRAPYVETDGPAPLNVYGQSKAKAEKLVLDRYPGSLVIRTSSFFSPWDQHNFITIALTALRGGESFVAAQDVTMSPTYVPDLVNACLDLLIDRESGIWHLTNGEALTWAALALRAAQLADVDPSGLQPRPNKTLQLSARRPTYSALSSQRSFVMPTLDDALHRYLASSAVHRPKGAGEPGAQLRS